MRFISRLVKNDSNELTRCVFNKYYASQTKKMGTQRSDYQHCWQNIKINKTNKKQKQVAQYYKHHYNHHQHHTNMYNI